MEDNKRRLNVITGKVVAGTTCFAVQANAGIDCQRQRCPHWIPHPESHNCVHIATMQRGRHTLQEIGQVYDLTRMRICQIEKLIFEQIKEAS